MKRIALLLLLPLFAVAQEPTLYVVGYAHLDTEWRWEYPRTIDEFLPNTMRDNFALFEKYPHYVFNFSGANRYRMMKEYDPADFERVRAYVNQGRWFPSGSSMEESDVNSPSAESIVRQILYGAHWFRRELGRSSAELMLPDSFGFPGSLPSILAHMGLRGFSTQKLTWGSAAGIPFNIGVWEGPDGGSVIAAFNPGSYSADLTYDLRATEPPEGVRRFVDWPARVRGNGVLVDYHYYGTGDVGGAPSESSVARLEAMLADPKPTLRIVSATAEQMFLDITPEQRSRLPRYEGELELTEHSAGSLTSEAFQKHLNRSNEVLADAAERASVAASWLGARTYPQERLERAWTLVMGGQFHDIAAGTSTPNAHQYAWNDGLLARNQFASVLTSATGAVASALDTQTRGTPIVVYNPLGIAREDIVEAALPASGGVRVFDPNGTEVPSQISNGRLLFLARVPSVSYAVYDVVPGGAAGFSPPKALTVTPNSLENARYRIRIDKNGDLAGIVDKTTGRELLHAPIRLALQTETPQQWPAWNMDWDDRQRPPRAYVSGPATVRIVESGPARVALEIARTTEGSRFVQTIRLAAGDAGNRIEIANAIDWRTPSASLKATFPLAVSNPKATYNWGVGTIARGNNDPKKYEVLSHEWIDLTDPQGARGVTILTGGKYGSDKPDDRTIRLTLLYTPGMDEGGGRAYPDQYSQDFGHHAFVYGLAAHDGHRADAQALRLEQPLLAFETSKHPGALGRAFSLLRVSNERVRVMALKKAETSDAIIVRLVNLDDAPANAALTFAAPVAAAGEVSGMEERIGSADLDALAFSPFELRTFAVRLEPGPRVAPPRAQPVAIPADTCITTRDGEKADRASLPAELLPSTLADGAIAFQTAQIEAVACTAAVLANGQTIALPKDARRVFLLMAADGDQRATFRIGDAEAPVTVQDWTGFIGQWDTRLWERRETILPPRPDAPPNAPPRRSRGLEYAGLAPGYVKPAPVAWFASHHHDPSGANVPYAYAYLFAYAFDVPARAATITLPRNDKIRIVAMTASDETAHTRWLQPVYDTLTR